VIQPDPLTVAKGAPGPGRGKKGIKAGFLKNPALSLAEQGVGTRLRRLGVPDRWAPAGSLDYIRRELGLDAEGIAEAVR